MKFDWDLERKTMDAFAHYASKRLIWRNDVRLDVSVYLFKTDEYTEISKLDDQFGIGCLEPVGDSVWLGGRFDIIESKEPPTFTPVIEPVWNLKGTCFITGQMLTNFQWMAIKHIITTLVKAAERSLIRYMGESMIKNAKNK